MKRKSRGRKGRKCKGGKRRDRDEKKDEDSMKGRNIAAGIAGAAALLCLGVGIFQFWQEDQAGSEYRKLQETVGTQIEKASEDAAREAREQAAEAAEDTRELPDIPMDFEELKAYNPDIYAWITIPGTAVDYPVVQRAGDNSYYLTHNTDGEESAAGAIYTEDYNSRDFMDPNTVLYGHNMRNGSMFRSLHSYMDRSFFDENREVIIYLPDAILRYEIFAAYLYDSRHLLLNFDFEDPEVFAGYLEEIRGIRDMNSFIDTSIEVTAEDRILTLSTCYKGMDDRRYLVQAVLVSIEE